MGDYPWIKLYPEILDDLKMKRLSLKQRWLWITVLCLANKSPVTGSLMITKSISMSLLDVGEAALLEVSEGEDLKEIVEEAFQKFEELEMVKIDKNGTVTVCNFLKRQGRKPSDSPEEVRKRVKKHRDKKKKEDCNAQCNTVKRQVTRIDKEEDKDKDKEKSIRHVGKSDTLQNSKKSFDEDFIQQLKENPAYESIDIDRELAKMDAWLQTPKGKRRQKTKGFIVNWLNRIDTPVQAETPDSRESLEDRAKRIEELVSSEGGNHGNSGGSYARAG